MPPFKIVIVGTGIAGLAAAIALADKGHAVTVVEATPALKAIGGIIVIQPNANRTMDRLGVYKDMMNIGGVRPLPIGIKSYSTGEWLTYRPPQDILGEFGYPFWQVHRADLQEVLYEAANKRGIELRLGCTVFGVDEEAGAILINGGERIEADLIVGADGIKSVVRKSAGLDTEGTTWDSGFDVTRANIPEDIVNSDPETAECMKHTALWYGPNSCIASVPIRRGNEYLLGYDFIHPRDDNSADGTSRPQNINQMKSYFKGFAPVIQKAFSYVDEAHVWRMQMTMAPSWVSKKGKVVLTGDAAHAVLPFAGQGGCMAMEDAVTLATCLSRAKTRAEIPRYLHAYQKIREPRCKLVQEFGSTTAKRATLADGPEQEERDRRMKKHNAFVKQEKWDGVHVDEVPESINTPMWMPWLLGHDPVDFTERKLDEEFGVVESNDHVV